MLESIYNIILKKNDFYDQNNYIFNMTQKSDLSKSIFNEFNKYLLSKEIEFENVFTEEKKDDDKNIVYTNFAINNLLNISNQKDRDFNFNNIKNNKSSKKKIDNYKSLLSESKYFLNSIKNSQIKKYQEKLKKSSIEPLSNEILKNNNQCFKTNELNNLNIKNFFYFKKISEPYLEKKTQFLNKNKHNIKSVKNEKKICFITNIKQNKNNFFSSKNIGKIENIISEKNIFKKFEKKENVQLDIEPFILNHSKNSIEWKKLIGQKILLSISNKKNQAEIHLKPESLGSINIVINMKNNKVTLDLFSNCDQVRFFLNNYITFLRDSLKKNGIKLEKFSVYSSLKNKELQHFQNLFYKKIFNSDEFKKPLNPYKKCLEKIKYKPIDVYV